MNIEIAVLIDSERVQVSEDLQKLINNILTGYIKNKIAINKFTKVLKLPKNPNAKREPRPQLSEEKIQRLAELAKEYQNLNLSSALRKIAEEIGCSIYTVYVRVKRMRDAGEVSFAKSPNYKNRWETKKINEQLNDSKINTPNPEEDITRTL